MHQRPLLGILLLASLAAAPLAAQGRGPKHYAVTADRAIVVTREVLVAKGYEVVRIEDRGPDRIVWYRQGNMGRGRGKGRLERLVVRRVENRIVFVDTPDVFLVDIDIRLKL
jgi:hypothetical protein